MVWKLVLKPGEKREVIFGVIVGHPKDRKTEPKHVVNYTQFPTRAELKF